MSGRRTEADGGREIKARQTVGRRTDTLASSQWPLARPLAISNTIQYRMVPQSMRARFDHVDVGLPGMSEISLCFCCQIISEPTTNIGVENGPRIRFAIRNVKIVLVQAT